MMSKLQKASGIYLMKFIGGYFYIGSAVNMRARQSRHLHHLRNNNHDNSRVQNVYNKYDNYVEFVVLEECSNDALIEVEQFYLDKYFSDEKCLNLCEIAGSTKGNKVWLGRKHKKSTIDKMKKSASLRGVKGSEHPTSKSVLKYDIEGNFIEEYGSVKDAAISIGLSDSSNICACLKGKKKSSKGYQFRYFSKNYPKKIDPVKRHKLFNNFKKKLRDESECI